MLRFDASSFAIAGIIASVAPIVIHMLNRQRFRTTHWAAMDFLREALERNQKRLHLRDVLLLSSRILAVLLFGLVLSKPSIKAESIGTVGPVVFLSLCVLLALGFAVTWTASSKGRGRGLAVGSCAALLATGALLFGFARQTSGDNAAETGARVPLHAVLIVDNSRSLGVESLGGTLLDRAKVKAAEFIDLLPLESRVTIIPLAGSEDLVTLDAFRNKEDARRALDRVKLIDVEARVRTGLEQAERAFQQTIDPPSKRVVLLTDLQANAWQGIAPELPRRLPGLQVVNVARGTARNVWVSGFHVEDGLTSVEVPCRFLARVHSNAADSDAEQSPNEDSFEVQAKLLIDGIEVASQTIPLMPGQERELEFTHQFDLLADPQRPSSAVATVEVQSEMPSMDQLPRDNQQQIVVPIVSSLPVVFVDQYGDEENLDQNKIGETYALRHLMAPRSSNDKSPRRLIHVEHVRPEQLTQERLETARLVVVGGIEKPDRAVVALLRDFVRQGGPLVILAGGQFDSAAWTDCAWLNGRGILPAPLNATPLGHSPEETSQQLQPFFASFPSMQHDFFLIEGEDPRNMASLFESTPFFKAVQVDLNEAILGELLQQDTKQFVEEKRFLDEYATHRAARLDNVDTGLNSDEGERRFREIEPVWWSWRSPLPLLDRSLPPVELARQSQPRVLASFDGNRGPFAIERRIGAGRIVFFTSGVTSNWNLLRGSGAMYLFHRTFCQLIERTLPTRNFLAGQKIAMPVESGPHSRYVVTRPSGDREPLAVDAMSSMVSGVTIRRPLVAGTYTISAEPIDDVSPGSSANKIEDIPFAVNGAESESDLTAISGRDLQIKLDDEDIRVLTADDTIRFDGGRHGRDLWKLLGWCVLGSLLFEKLILAWPMWSSSPRGENG